VPKDTLNPAKPLIQGFAGDKIRDTGRIWGDFYYSFQIVLRISRSRAKKPLKYLAIS